MKDKRETGAKPPPEIPSTEAGPGERAGAATEKPPELTEDAQVETPRTEEQREREPLERKRRGGASSPESVRQELRRRMPGNRKARSGTLEQADETDDELPLPEVKDDLLPEFPDELSGLASLESVRREMKRRITSGRKAKKTETRKGKKPVRAAEPPEPAEPLKSAELPKLVSPDDEAVRPPLPVREESLPSAIGEETKPAVTEPAAVSGKPEEIPAEKATPEEAEKPSAAEAGQEPVTAESETGKQPETQESADIPKDEAAEPSSAVPAGESRAEETTPVHPPEEPEPAQPPEEAKPAETAEEPGAAEPSSQEAEPAPPESAGAETPKTPEPEEPETPKPEEPASQPVPGDAEPQPPRTKRRRVQTPEPKRGKREKEPEPKAKTPETYQPKRLQERRKEFQRRRVEQAWSRWALFFAVSLAYGIAVTVAAESVRAGSFSEMWEWAAWSPGSFLLTILIYGGSTALLGAVLGRLWPAGAAVSAVAMIAVLVDHFKTAINGTPLVLADFGLAGQAQQVAGVAGDLHLPGSFWPALAVLLAGTGLLFMGGPLTHPRRIRARLARAVPAFLLCAVLFSGTFAYGLGQALGLDMDLVRDPFASHNHYGLTVSLWREFFQREKQPPKGYSEEYMRQALYELDGMLLDQPARPSLSEPNVIIILSESFFDITRLPNVTFDRDPVENYHALQKESLSGPFFSHYLGYGTGYIEMSMQTGWSMVDLLPGENICFMPDETYELFDALAEQYTNTGRYTAEMLHGYDDSLYNRVVTYPLLGYERSLYSADIQALGIEYPGGVYGGYYMRDAYLYQGLLQEMERINGEGNRAFMYAITMENHQPFRPDKFNYKCQVKAQSDVLTDAEMEIFKVGLEGITRADQALGELVEALRKSPEPTVVAFFGDHRPTLPMPDGETVYTKLGQSPGNNTALWAEEEYQEVYSSDYLIWANDAALLQGMEGERRPSGVLAFGPTVLELTGRSTSRYWGLMKLAATTELARNWAYFVSGEGKLVFDRQEAGLTEEQEEILRLRDSVIYDALFGEQYVTAAMNQPPGMYLPSGS